MESKRVLFFLLVNVSQGLFWSKDSSPQDDIMFFLGSGICDRYEAVLPTVHREGFCSPR